MVTYVSTNAQIKVESKSNHLQECCGYEANFLATPEQRAGIAISIGKQFQTFAQLLAILLANQQVQDSPTTKIKTAKFSETNFGLFRESLHTQPYGNPHTCLFDHIIAKETMNYLEAV